MVETKTAAAIHIREVEHGDAEAICAIYSHYVATSLATLQEDEPTVHSMQSKAVRLQNFGMPYLVAEDEATGTLLGYSNASPHSDRTGYKHTAEDTVYIAPEFCGQGIARPLLRAVLDKLKESGNIKVVLARISIEPGVETSDLPSCKLHLRMGFREVGRLERVGFKLGRLVDVVISQLDLDALQ